MHYSKALTIAGLALAAPADGFVATSGHAARPRSSLSAALDQDNERQDANVIRNVAAASALAMGLLLSPVNALAAQDALSLLPSVEISAAIQTMDFSMPGSYDSISDPLASGKDELTQTTVVNTGGSKKKAAASGSSKEDAKAAREARVAERKAKEAEQAIRDEQAARERDENIKAARLEKAAARAAAQAEKEAAAAEKAEEAKFKGAKFMDDSMPSY